MPLDAMNTVADTPLRTVVVTGGIGSGKSMVCALLAEKGIPVYDSDSRTKALYRGPLLQRIESAFGRSFTLPAPADASRPAAGAGIASAPAGMPSAAVIPGRCPGNFSAAVEAVDFAALSAAAFASPDSLALLESIVHPAVLADFTAWRDAQALGTGLEAGGAASSSSGPSGELPVPPFVVLESAIILDKPLFDGLYDTVVLVYAPEQVRLDRVLARNPDLSADAVRRRLSAQHFDFSRADYLLINDTTPAALRIQVDALYAALSAHR
jgi:dephospho-CoA kinase